MKESFFMIIISVFVLSGLYLFIQGNCLMAQPEMGLPRGEQLGMGQPGMEQSDNIAHLNQQLEAYSLPSGPITEDDIPEIKTVIQDVLTRISEYLKNPPMPSGRGFMSMLQPEDESEEVSDMETIKSGILAFQDWLNLQGGVSQASALYDGEATDKYSDNIFLTYPGQLPFDIVFNMEGDIRKQYRLLVFISTVDLFSFASLIEDKGIKDWERVPEFPYLVPAGS